MNKSKGSKTNNRRGAKGVTTATSGGGENGGSEKKKTVSKKNKTSGKSSKKISMEEKSKSPPELPKENQLPEGKKLERSNSFISRGLSKLYNTITGSRDGINKTSSGESLESHDKVPEPPVFLRRSRTLGTISLRKHRRSIPTPLEELVEESEQKPPEPQRMTSVEEKSHGMTSAFSASRESLSSSIFGRLKRTFSISSDKRKSGMNPRWSASLQSLQQVDNVISYEDLSFINYDEFNHIEKQVDRALSQLDVKSTGRNVKQHTTVDSAGATTQQKYPEVVKRVKRRESPTVTPKFQCDWDANFDKDKNLYRQSLDTDKLQTLSRFNRKSFRWSNVFEPIPMDYLQLETPENSKRVSFASERMIYEDSVHLFEAASHSKSLSNLTDQETTLIQLLEIIDE
ncbi:hypothetical protein DMENIID0001_021320 [Sergentomyia squamirostris]